MRTYLFWWWHHYTLLFISSQAYVPKCHIYKPPGFEPADDDKPHIALANIRQRLKMMCRGEMKIMQREGKGTVVRLIIPDKSR